MFLFPGSALSHKSSFLIGNAGDWFFAFEMLLVQLYVLTNDKDGELSIVRFGSTSSGRAEVVAPVDMFEAAEWAEPLRLLLVYEREETFSCQSLPGFNVSKLSQFPANSVAECSPSSQKT